MLNFILHVLIAKRLPAYKGLGIVQTAGIFMRRSVLFIVASLFAGAAHASCVGTDTYQSCYDYQSGNSYSVQRYGNATNVYGNNARTGSTWSQQTYDYGNTSQTYGRDSRGNSWNQTCTYGTCY